MSRGTRHLSNCGFKKHRASFDKLPETSSGQAGQAGSPKFRNPKFCPMLNALLKADG